MLGEKNVEVTLGERWFWVSYDGGKRWKIGGKKIVESSKW